MTLYGARIGISAAKNNWRLAAFGKNLSNESHFSQKVSQPANAFISAGGVAGAQGFAGFYSPPRTYGVDATVKF